MGKFYGFTNWYFILNFSSYFFTLFTYKAPNGMRAMGALANAAIATFLVKHSTSMLVEVFGIKFLEGVRGCCGRSRRRCCSRIDYACDWCVSSLRTSYWCCLWWHGSLTRFLRRVPYRLRYEVH